MENLTRQRETVDQFHVHAAICRDLKGFCAREGIDVVPLAKAANLNPDDFESFEKYISLDRLCSLMRTLSALLHDEAIGLRYALYFKPGGTGPYGLGLRAAPTFREMLRFYVRYSELVSHSQLLNVNVGKDSFSIEWRYSPLILNQEFFADFSACAAINLFGAFIGAPVRPNAGQLMRAPPQNNSLYDAELSDRITYDAPTNKLVFSNDLLNLNNPSANRNAFEYMCLQCDALIEKLRRPKSVYTAVCEDLMLHPDRKEANIAAVAQRLALSERTLQRRLASAGTDFSRIAEETQDGISLRMLCDTEQPISTIARTLGYGSQSAYARWVKRLHAASPTQIRRTQSTRPARDAIAPPQRGK